MLLAAAAVALAAIGRAHAQAAPGWDACTAITEAPARLACFDAWAASQRPAPSRADSVAAPQPAAPAAPAATATAAQPAPPRRGLGLTAREGCHDARYSELSRFWELEPGADCGTYGLRGFHPMNIDVAKGDTVNQQPTSGNPLNNAPSPLAYETTEMRLQLSVRTKLAQNLFTRNRPGASDSIWFAYTQQSYWQLFNPDLSRPFRSTDHEPEVIYILPLQAADPDRWRLRFGGLGIVHQSNGQSLPLSRSWNRVYLMAGAENGRLLVQARAWERLPENAATDDNPDISDYIGRAEARVTWHANRDNLWSLTGRHSLRAAGRGSWRLEWFRTLGDRAEGPPGGLQLHTELFTGYGDSLLDYNRRRTVFTVGLSLVEW
jgi:phospholipase A1/A2